MILRAVRICSLVIVGLLLQIQSSCSFLLNRLMTESQSLVTPPSPLTVMFAKKARQKPTDSKGPSVSGGFGTSAPVSPLQGKLRAVTGKATGAGSKPLRHAANTFDSLRKEHGIESCHDVYVRSPGNSATTYWFVGKIARDLTSSATPTEAVLSQKRIILEYSKQQLRPRNLGGKYASTLEIWLAPGDSEMGVVQNKISLEKVVGSVLDLSEDFLVATVGYNPEIYVGDELTKGGLRVERDEEGRPIKPVFDVNESA